MIHSSWNEQGGRGQKLLIYDVFFREGSLKIRYVSIWGGGVKKDQTNSDVFYGRPHTWAWTFLVLQTRDWLSNWAAHYFSQMFPFCFYLKLLNLLTRKILLNSFAKELIKRGRSHISCTAWQAVYAITCFFCKKCLTYLAGWFTLHHKQSSWCIAKGAML